MKNPAMEAVRELRTRLGDTQQAFAARTGLAISTVVRYELSRPPRGQALAAFERLAFENGHRDLAAAFRLASLADAGISTADKTVPVEERNTLAIPPGYEAALLAFIDVLSMPSLAKERAKILAILKDRIALYAKVWQGASDEG